MKTIPDVRMLILACAALGGGVAHAADYPTLRGTLGTAEPAPTNQGIYVGARGGIAATRASSYDSGAQTLDSTFEFIDPFVDVLTGNLIGPFVLDTTRSLRARVAQTYDYGYNYSGFVGYDFGSFMDGFGARMELEAGRFSNNISSIMVTGTEQTVTNVTSPQQTVRVQTPEQTFATNYNSGISGRTHVTYLLANYYVDWNLGWVRPYVGAGIGLGHVNLANHGIPGVTFMNDQGWGWAYQFGGGLSIDVMPNVALEGGYRILGVRDVSVTSTAGQTDKVAVTTQQVNVGVRVRF